MKTTMKTVKTVKTVAKPCIAATTAALLLALTGCAGQVGGAPTPTPSTAAAALHIEKAWVKAADSGMTAAFGEIANAGGAAVTIVSASSNAAPDLQLHETATGSGGTTTMREKKGGFTIPAGKTLELAPGGNHIMFMSLADPLLAGQEVPIALTLSDGSTFRFTAPVKDFTGANEEYHEGDGDMGHDK